MISIRVSNLRAEGPVRDTADRLLRVVADFTINIGVRRVKSTDGPDLIVSGSSTLTSVLLDQGLVDDVVLELAVEAECEAILTYNQRDFAGAEQFGVRGLAPKAFLQEKGVLP